MIQCVGQFFIAIHPSEMRAMSTTYSELYKMEVAKSAYLAMFGGEVQESESTLWEDVPLGGAGVADVNVLGGMDDADLEGSFRLMEIDGNLVGLHTFILNSSPDDLRQYIAAESAVEKRWEHPAALGAARGSTFMVHA